MWNASHKNKYYRIFDFFEITVREIHYKDNVKCNKTIT